MLYKQFVETLCNPVCLVIRPEKVILRRHDVTCPLNLPVALNVKRPCPHLLYRASSCSGAPQWAKLYREQVGGVVDAAYVESNKNGKAPGDQFLSVCH